MQSDEWTVGGVEDREDDVFAAFSPRVVSLTPQRPFLLTLFASFAETPRRGLQNEWSDWMRRLKQENS